MKEGIKLKNKFLSLLVIMCICILSFGAINVSAATSGTCGENLTWTFDESTGELVISGTGEMYNYLGEDAPWYSNCANIKKVEISYGVTSIGDYAFKTAQVLLA